MITIDLNIFGDNVVIDYAYKGETDVWLENFPPQRASTTGCRDTLPTLRISCAVQASLIYNSYWLLGLYIAKSKQSI